MSIKHLLLALSIFISCTHDISALPDVATLKQEIAQNPEKKEQYFAQILALDDASMQDYLRSFHEFPFPLNVKKNVLIEYALDHFGQLSIFANNQIYAVVGWDESYLKELVKKSIAKYGEAQESDLTLSIMIRKNAGKLANGSDAKPICVFDTVLGQHHTRRFECEDIMQLALKDLSKISIDDLTIVYEFYATVEQKKQIRTWARAHYGKEEIDFSQETMADLPQKLSKPGFLYTCSSKNSRPRTASEKHFCKNIARIVTLKNRYLERFKKPTVKKMLWNAFLKEIEETQKGNYVFFHGRQWKWDFIADIYKQLHNLKATPQDRLPDHYVPLRFGDSEGTGFCMNYALFGNAGDEGSSTISYVLRNHDYSHNKFDNYSTKSLFTKFGLSEIYEKYAAQLQEIEDLHEQSNADNYGSLLLLSVRSQDTHNIFPSSSGAWGNAVYGIDIDGTITHDIKKIIAALRTKPSLIQKGESDRIEFGMVLTKDYALDPKKGLVIFRFNAADQEKYNHYCAQRDSLFAMIAKEVR